MSAKLVVGLVGLGIIVLFLGLLLPPVISAPSSDISESHLLAVDETAETGPISVTLSDVDVTESTLTANVTDTETSETFSPTIAENETETLSYADGDVNVTANTLYSAGNAGVTVDVSPTHGWSDGATLFSDHFGLVLVVIAFMMVMGLLGVALRGGV